MHAPSGWPSECEIRCPSAGLRASGACRRQDQQRWCRGRDSRPGQRGRVRSSAGAHTGASSDAPHWATRVSCDCPISPGCDLDAWMGAHRSVIYRASIYYLRMRSRMGTANGAPSGLPCARRSRTHQALLRPTRCAMDDGMVWTKPPRGCWCSEHVGHALDNVPSAARVLPRSQPSASTWAYGVAFSHGSE